MGLVSGGGHIVVLWDLNLNDSVVHLNPIENGVTHSLKVTYCFLFFSSPLGLQARCILPCNYTPSFGGMKGAHHHLAGRSWWTQRACWDFLLSWYALLSTWCENNIRPSIFCYLVLIPGKTPSLGESQEYTLGRSTTRQQRSLHCVNCAQLLMFITLLEYGTWLCIHINEHEFTQNSLFYTKVHDYIVTGHIFLIHLGTTEAQSFSGPRFCGHSRGMKTQKKRTTAFLLPLCQFDNYSPFKLPSQWKGKLVNVLTRWIWSGESQKQLRNNRLGHHISPWSKP